MGCKYFRQVVFPKMHLIGRHIKVLRLLSTLRRFEPATVVMEACYMAFPWGCAIGPGKDKKRPPYDL
jgi:hypothetical protein